MKKALLILAVLGLAAAIGYVLGTEQGRQQKAQAMARLRSAPDPFAEAADDQGADLREAGTNGVEAGEIAHI